MSEEMGLPGTSGGAAYPPVGMNRMHIIKIEKYLDDKGYAKKDSRDYPGLTITFATEKNEIIKDHFYYSTLPLDHADRNDPDKKCKSEFFLTNLKRALGFGEGPVSAGDLKSKWFWAPIKLLQYVDKNKKPLDKKFHVLQKEFWADQGNKPLVAGDPTVDGQEMGGIFYEEKVDYKGKYKQSEEPAQKPPSQQEDEAPKDDMPVDEDDY